MIAIDTNILVYADRAEMPRHSAALSELRRLAEGDEAWGLPIFCLGEFVRVVSHPLVFNSPTPANEALDSLDALLESPSARLLVPGPRFLPILRRVLAESGVAGNLVFDAQIAAVCLEHGARTILTEDRDFSRFAGIATRSLPA
ncbi:MAG: PIN domain-containing protein [Deltaproteobacteria bacterium]|nr:PIN domain-containing protein [Deltaproteobacteria bacterium]